VVDAFSSSAINHFVAYIMDSEPALERTYADPTMILRPEMRRFRLLDILLVNITQLGKTTDKR